MSLPDEHTLDGAAASATGSCEPERLDTPIAYVISDSTVVPPLHAGAGMAVAFQVAWPNGLSEGEYPSTNACFIDVFAPSGGSVRDPVLHARGGAGAGSSRTYGSVGWVRVNLRGQCHGLALTTRVARSSSG